MLPTPVCIGFVVYSLCLRDKALVQINDMIANEPDQVREVGNSSLVVDVLQHRGVVH